VSAAKSSAKSAAKPAAKPAAKRGTMRKPAVKARTSRHDGAPDAANRLAATFARLKTDGKKAFIAYICAGDPDLDTTVELVCAMAEQGVDVIELGVPYSDPMADGVAIQAACERALAGGASLRGVLDAVRRIRARTQVPLVAFTYVNPVLAYGVERFAADAVTAGIDAVLPLDLPPDEDHAVIAAFRSAGLANVCLAAPTTTPARKRFLAQESRGFLYYVCRLGVTGERATLPADLGRQVAALKRVSSAPVCIGFGISTPEQAAEAAAHGDGVIVGSHLVRLIERGAATRSELVTTVAARAGALAAAVHAV